MPRFDNSVFLSTGDPKTSVDTAPTGGPLPRLGELGKVYQDSTGGRWQRVKGAATFTRTPVAQDLFYWSDATKMLADSDIGDSEAGRNQVAGCIPTGATVPTAGQLFWALQEKRQTKLNGTAVNFTPAASNIIAFSTGGLVTFIAAGTASTYQPIGTLHTAVDLSGGAGDVVVDLAILSPLY